MIPGRFALRLALVSLVAVIGYGLAIADAGAEDGALVVSNLQAILSGNSPWPGGPPPAIKARLVAGETVVRVVVIAGKDKLHHDTTDDHIIIVQAGTGKARFNDRTYDVKAGDVIFLPHNTKHAFERTGGGELILLTTGNLHAKPEQLVHDE